MPHLAHRGPAHSLHLSKETSVLFSPLRICINSITNVRISSLEAINSADNSAFFFQRKARRGCLRHAIHSMNLMAQHAKAERRKIHLILAVNQFIKWSTRVNNPCHFTLAASTASFYFPFVLLSLFRIVRSKAGHGKDCFKTKKSF